DQRCVAAAGTGLTDVNRYPSLRDGFHGTRPGPAAAGRAVDHDGRASETVDEPVPAHGRTDAEGCIRAIRAEVGRTAFHERGAEAHVAEVALDPFRCDADD